jgi:hypothetical protein
MCRQIKSQPGGLNQAGLGFLTTFGIVFLVDRWLMLKKEAHGTL